MVQIPSRGRVRFQKFEFETLPNGRCSARVVLQVQEGGAHTGSAAGMASPAGELRCAAQAAAEALHNAVDEQLEFELLGVKAVRAFDSTVVIVSLSCREEGEHTRLVGSCLAEDNLPRGAALAVLNATNRMLDNMIFMK